MDDAVPAAAAVTSLLFAFLTVLGNGSPWQGIKRVFEDLWNGIKKIFEDLWSGIKKIFGAAPAIPRPDYDELNELLRWNGLWEPPERGDFYVWDSHRQVFEENPLPTLTRR